MQNPTQRGTNPPPEAANPLGDFDPAILDATTPQADVSDTPDVEPEVLFPQVTSPRRRGTSLLLPLLAILGAGILLSIRAGIADWSPETWRLPWSTTIATPEKPSTLPLIPEPAEDPQAARAEAPELAAVQAHDPAHRPDASAPAEELVGDAVALSEEAPGFVGPPRIAQSRDDLQREADRIRAEREELEKIKKAEGEKLAKAPRRPGLRFEAVDPALMARRHAEIQRRLLAQMEAHRRQFEAFQREQDEFFNRRGFPRQGAAGDGFDDAFAAMRREMLAFEREALGMMRAAPPFDVPAPPQPNPPDAQQAAPDWPPDANWPPEARPQLRSFRRVDPRTGAVISGFEMRWNR